MAELISLRECGRRLNVSDTAVRKAIKSGRITVAGKNPSNGRPLVDFERVLADWNRNTDPSMQRKAEGEPVNGMLKPAAKVAPNAEPQPDKAAAASGGPSYNTSRAVREAYAARLIKIEYEERIGKLVPIDEVAATVEAEYTRVRTRLLGIASKLAPDVALADDEAKCRALIEAAVVDALKELTADADINRREAA